MSRRPKTSILLAWLISFIFPLSVQAHQILFYYNSYDGTDGALLQCVKILQEAGHKVKVINLAGKSYDPTGDHWGPPYDQVWDMRFVNQDKKDCGSGSPKAADYFTEKWRSKAVSYLNNCGKLFIAGEYYLLTDRDEGLYRFLLDIGAVKKGFDPCPPSSRGNSATEDEDFYQVRNGLGVRTFYGDYVGGIPKTYLTGTSFVETRENWLNNDKINRSIVSGWKGSQMGGLINCPQTCRGKLFMVWDATMWTLWQQDVEDEIRNEPPAWEESTWFSNDPESTEERERIKNYQRARTVTKKFFPAVANWLGNAPCPCEPYLAPPVQMPLPTMVPPVLTVLPVLVRSQLSAVSSSTGNLSRTPTTNLLTPTAYLSPSGAPETIVFTSPPINLYMGFRDGVGEYRLEVLDASGNHLKTLFDQSVMANQKEAWASWDGTNDLGHPAGAGSYFAVLSKDGRFLKKIVLSWAVR